MKWVIRVGLIVLALLLAAGGFWFLPQPQHCDGERRDQQQLHAGRGCAARQFERSHHGGG